MEQASDRTGRCCGNPRQNGGGQRYSNPCLNRDHAFAIHHELFQIDDFRDTDGTKTSGLESLVRLALNCGSDRVKFRLHPALVARPESCSNFVRGSSEECSVEDLRGSGHSWLPRTRRVARISTRYRPPDARSRRVIRWPGDDPLGTVGALGRWIRDGRQPHSPCSRRSGTYRRAEHRHQADWRAATRREPLMSSSTGVRAPSRSDNCVSSSARQRDPGAIGSQDRNARATPRPESGPGRPIRRPAPLTGVSPGSHASSQPVPSPFHLGLHGALPARPPLGLWGGGMSI